MSDHAAEGRCRYPQSHATARDIRTEIAGVASNRSSCTSCYLDSVESMGEHPPSSGGSHHQGVARTHRLSDGSIYFFLSHSEVGGRIAGVESWNGARGTSPSTGTGVRRKASTSSRPIR